MGSLCFRGSAVSVAPKAGQSVATDKTIHENTNKTQVEKMSMQARIAARDQLEEQRRQKVLMELKEKEAHHAPEPAYTSSEAAGSPADILSIHDFSFSMRNVEGNAPGMMEEMRDDHPEPSPSPPDANSSSQSRRAVQDGAPAKEVDTRQLLSLSREQPSAESPSPFYPRGVSVTLSIRPGSPKEVGNSEASVRTVSVEESPQPWTLPEGVIIARAPPAPESTSREEPKSHVKDLRAPLPPIIVSDNANATPFSSSPPSSRSASSLVVPSEASKNDVDAPSAKLAQLLHEKTTPGSSFAISSPPTVEKSGCLGQESLDTREGPMSAQAAVEGRESEGEEKEAVEEKEIHTQEDVEEVQEEQQEQEEVVDHPQPPSSLPPSPLLSHTTLPSSEEENKTRAVSHQDPIAGMRNPGGEGEREMEEEKEKEMTERATEGEGVMRTPVPSASSSNRGRVSDDQEEEQKEEEENPTENLLHEVEVGFPDTPTDEEDEEGKRSRGRDGEVENEMLRRNTSTRLDETSSSYDDPQHHNPRHHPTHSDDELPFSQPLNSVEMEEAAQLHREDLERNENEEDVMVVASSEIHDQESSAWASHPASVEQISASNVEELGAGQEEAGEEQESERQVEDRQEISEDEKPIYIPKDASEEVVLSPPRESNVERSNSASFSGQGFVPPPPCSPGNEEEEEEEVVFHSDKVPWAHDSAETELVHKRTFPSIPAEEEQQENVLGVEQTPPPRRRPPPPIPSLSSDDEEFET